MSVIHGVAWGLVEIDDTNFKWIRREARSEARTHRIHIFPYGGQYRVVSAGKKSGHRRRAYHGHGDLTECCKIVSKLITPSNPEK